MEPQDPNNQEQPNSPPPVSRLFGVVHPPITSPLAMPLFTFFQIYQQRILDSDALEEIPIENTTYHGYDDSYMIEERSPKRQRTTKGYVPIVNVTDQYNKLLLNSGMMLYFNEDDGLYLLIPYWFESNMFVRKIVSRALRSVRHGLKYLNKVMKEEEGYDNNGEMIYYHLRDQVFESYLAERRLRNAMRKVLMRWRIYKMDQRHEEEIDPITQFAPEKRVVLYDWSMKKKCIFDAKSLATHVETALLYHESGFALPKYPRNPWTNIDFTYRQLFSIYLQLKEHGELRWGLATLRDHNFELDTWRRYYHSAITMKAIQNSLIHLDCTSARELLEDFIIMKLEELSPVNDFIRQCYRKAILHIPHHWYLQRWTNIAFQHFEAQHFGINQNPLINEQREYLIRQQHIFFKELEQKGLLPLA